MKLQETHAFKRALGTLWLLLLGLYGSCSLGYMGPALGYHLLLNRLTMENADIQACYWVSMARALGSLWLLNASETVRNARIQACSWVSMAPALGSLWLLLFNVYAS